LHTGHAKDSALHLFAEKEQSDYEKAQFVGTDVDTYFSGM